MVAISAFIAWHLVPAMALGRTGPPPPPVERHELLILGVIVLVLAEGALIAALLMSRARRRDTEARNSAILRAVPDLMFLQTKDGVYLDYHVKDPSILIVPPSAFMGKRMRDVLPPTLARAIEGAIARLEGGEEPALVEYEVPGARGEARYYEARLVSCASDKVLSIVRDITERRRADTELRGERLRHTLATAAGGVGVWEWNLATNEVYADTELKALLGYTDAEIGNSMLEWRRLVHPRDVEAGLVDSLDAPSSSEREVRMLHKDGSIRWFLVRGAVARSERGVPTGVIGTSTDITERKRSADELNRAHAELLQTSRLAVLGEFAGSIAHELAQPLTAIMANAHACLRWLDRPAPDLGEVRDGLRDILGSGNLAREVISHTRHLYSQDHIASLPLRVTEVIEEVGVMVSSTLEAKRIVMDVRVAPDVPMVLGDRVQLRQVVLNLISNGIQAIEALAVGRPRRLTICLAVDDSGAARVTVSDTGIGLANVDRELLFSTSYTTKPDGMGWGLSISRSIIEAHGGRLWAEPNATGGADFSFTLPPTCVDSPGDGARAAAGHEAASGGSSTRAPRRDFHRVQ